MFELSWSSILSRNAIGNRNPLTIRPGVGAASLVGTRRQAEEGGPAVALSRRRRGSQASGGPVWCAFAHGLLREAGPPPGLQPGRDKGGCSPEAPALPGSGPVLGHAPGSGETTLLLCPSTGAAARRPSVRPGRRVPQRATTATPGGLFASKANQPSDPWAKSQDAPRTTC